MALKRILLVDPDSRSREKSALRFSVMDLEVLEAADAGEALGFLENGNPDLIVTDWPLLAGEKTSLFQGRLQAGPLPVVFCSSDPEGKRSLPVPTRAQHVFVPKEDRKEIGNQVERLLSEGGDPKGREEPKRGRQILVIEDSPTLRGIIRRTLEKGFPQDVVREAEEGRQALSQMSQKKVDLIVTDLEMPGMDGMTFLNHLKSSPLLSRKPVLIFSSRISAELRERVALSPNIRFLAKPAAPERILEEAAILLAL